MYRPHDIVKQAMDVYLDAFAHGNSEDVIFGRPATEFEPTSRATKVSHDAAMIGKVARLHYDHAMLPLITVILGSLVEKQYHAIVSKYMLIGLMPEKKVTWSDQDRAKHVAQEYGDYVSNLSRARKKVFAKLQESVKQSVTCKKSPLISSQLSP